MQRCFRILTMFVWLAAFYSVEGRLQAQQTTKGKDFYVAFLPNIHQIPGASDYLYLYVSAEKATSGFIAYNDGLRSYNQPFLLSAGQIFSMQIPWADAEPRGYNQMSNFVNGNENEKVTHRSFHVTASEDVSVYALNHAVTTADAAMVFPTPALGTEYYVMSYKSDFLLQNQNQLSITSTPSEFVIVATQNNTVVQVYPSVPTTETGMNVKSVILNAGDTWLCQAQFNTSNLHYDLSGTRVESTAPIALFGGHQRATVPVEDGAVAISRDQLYEEMPPTSVWGLNYIITPLPTPPGTRVISGATDLYRIVAAQNGTTVSFNGVALTTLNAGQVFEAPLTQAGLLSASSKILVSLVRQTSSDDNGHLQAGDPFMLIVPPRSQYMKNYTVMSCEATGEYLYQFVTIITAGSNSSSVLLDSAQVKSSLWNPIPGTCYVYAHVPVTSGVHIVNSPRLVGLYVSAYGYALSYGYVGGMSFVPDIGNDALTGGPDQSMCIGDTVVLQSTGKAVSRRWTQAGSTQRFPCDTCPSIVVHPLSSTRYIFSGTDSLGCDIVDTVLVTVHEIPDVSISPVHELCTDVPVTLHANGSFESIEWTPSTGLSCTTCNNPIANPGKDITYYATVRNGSSARCMAVDSVRVRYRYGISKAFPTGDTICKGDSALLRLHYGGSLHWSPSNTLSCASCDSVMAFPSSTTTYTVRADSADCTSQAQVTVTVVNPPTLSIAHDVNVCKGQAAALSVTTNASRIQWSPPTSLSATNRSQVMVTTDSDMLYTVEASYNANGCRAIDTVHVHVLSVPSVQLSATDTVVCGSSPVSIHASVSNASLIRWQPTAGLSCDSCADVEINTSSDQDFVVWAINANGCRDSAVIHVHVRNAPSLSLQDHNLKTCSSAPIGLHATSNQPVDWQPDSVLSCSACSDPIATFPSPGRYVVRAHAAISGGCDVYDSVVVQVFAVPADSLVSDLDTICSSSGAAHLSFMHASPGESYLWDATSPGLSDYSSASPDALPQVTTTYRVRVTNSDGCFVDRQITIAVIPCDRQLQVSSADAGTLSACGSAFARITLHNSGHVPIQIDSILEFAQIGATASLDTSVHLPLQLGVGETRDVPVKLVPTTRGAVQVDFRVVSSSSAIAGDSSTVVSVRASAIAYPLELTSRSIAVSAGQTVRLPIDIHSDDWQNIDLHEILIRLRYAQRWMEYRDTTELGVALMTKGWKVLSDSLWHDNADDLLQFRLRGDSALSLDGIAILPRFQILLSPDEEFALHIDSVWFPAEQRCINVSTQDEILQSIGCARNLRQVTSTGQNFDLLQVDPNPARELLKCVYSIPFECEPQLHIIDALGRRIEILHSVQQAPGTYELLSDISSLANGMYTLHFQACGRDLLRSFVVQH